MTWRLPALGGGVATDIALDDALGSEPGMPGPWVPRGVGRWCAWPSGVAACAVERAPGGWRVVVWGPGGAGEFRGSVLLPGGGGPEEAQAIGLRILRAWARGGT